MPRTTKPAHYGGSYHIASRKVRQAANADPTYRCPRCGLTRDEGRARWGAGGNWDAGHRQAGEIGGPLRAEHAHCNRSHGQKLSVISKRRRARTGTDRKVSRRW